jgi:hypothetical protein
VTPAELTAHYAKLIEDVFQHVLSGNEAAAADILAAHDREIVALADASQAAAVALARQSRAAEISAACRRLARETVPIVAETYGVVATAIDNGRF